MRRRQTILLLELLISLLIIGFIFEMLFLGYRQTLIIKQKIREAKEIVLGRQRLILRLSTVFRTIQSCEQLSDGWMLRYEGGMDPEMRFRGLLDAMLYVKNGQLMLISWPKQGSPRVETLYEDQKLKSVLISFFDQKTALFQPLFPATKPLMMKMTLDLPLELPFFL